MTGSSSRIRRVPAFIPLRQFSVAALCALTLGMAPPGTADQATAAETPPQMAAAAGPAPYVDSNATIPNPERGLFDHNGDCNTNPFNEDRLVRLRRDQHITLVRCIFYLEGYQRKALDQPVFDKLANRAATARKLGLKLVLRFAYSKTTDSDATVARAEAHIDQLKPFLVANSSVIHVLESGFVGRYGEGYYTHQYAPSPCTTNCVTDDYGNAGQVTTAQWDRRKRIVDRLLAVLPAGRSTQVRTVAMKSTMYGPTVTLVGPPAKPGAARVGLHNDCLFGYYKSDPNDQGTYRNDADRSFLAGDSKYVPVGGEICGVVGPTPARTDCPNAMNELSKYHWTHLSNGQGVTTREKWAAQGCMASVEQRLGYRLSLAGALFPATVRRGQTFLAQVVIRNNGWAAPISDRPVQLVLRNTATGKESTLPFTYARPRTWYPGTSTLISAQFGIGSSTAPGTYDLLLRLPDADPALRTAVTIDPLNPYPYNIQLATQNAWERDSQGRSTGLNRLSRSIQVTL